MEHLVLECYKLHLFHFFTIDYILERKIVVSLFLNIFLFVKLPVLAS